MLEKTNSTANSVIKILFVLGLGSLFMSFFFEWYQFSAHLEDGSLVGDWKFYMFLGWKSIFVEDISPNDSFRPADIPDAHLMSIISIVFIFICGYGIAFKPVERTSSSRGAKPFVYCNVILLVLNGYFLTFLPCQLIATKGLFFPFLQITHIDSSITLTYSVSLGYILQVISFLTMFSHVVFSLQTINKFEINQESTKVLVKQRIKQSQDEIPLDRYIAEEELKLTRSKEEDLASVVLYKFKKSRKRV
ncbi:MAG: hypothetical protein ACFFAS_20105 [Promethearchaeota archaeon]